MHVWRRKTGTTYQHRADAKLPPLSDAEVLRTYELMFPETMVRLLRLNLLVRIAAGPNSTMKATIFAARDAPKSWIAAVTLDFLWFKELCAELQSEFLDGCDKLTDWICIVRLNSLQWKKHLQKSCW